jgi:hypothetical protein
MAIDTGVLTEKLVAAGRGLTGNIWEQMKTFAIPELKKIAVQVEALADPHSGFKPEAKVVLFRMQVDAAISVIVAMTSLVLLEVQEAINAILKAVKDFVNGAVGIPLI